jgi:CheY-like chemotaxis protein/HPt (histidine-containing phosphotransfer) domain-containing protein
MMRLILTREDHHVELASDGFEACSLAEQKRFDIILMDLQMPEMDGVETSRRIRALDGGSKKSYIVALTASYLPEKGSELFEAGIDNYIAKPFDVEHLRQILKYGIDHYKNKPTYEPEEPITVNQNGVWGFDPSDGLRQVGGDEEVFRGLLSDFVRELPQRIATMKKHLDVKDMDGLSRSAHSLKGISANLGALQLSQHADRLENRASEGYTESVITEMKAIKALTDEFIHNASNFLDAGNE